MPITQEDQDFVYAFGTVEGNIQGELIGNQWLTTMYIYDTYVYVYDPSAPFLANWLVRAQELDVITSFDYDMTVSGFIMPATPTCPTSS